MTRLLASSTLALALAVPAFAQDTPDLSGVSIAVDAATASGILDTLDPAQTYTAFVPTNTALEPVAGDAPTDPAELSALVAAYVIPGTVMAADAIKLVTDGSGMASVDSAGGSKIELAMDGETLTVNGAPVVTPDITIGNVTIHVIDGAFLPDAAM